MNLGEATKKVFQSKGKELQHEGRLIRLISKSLKIHIQTVKKYFKTEEYPMYEGKRISNFDMFQDYLSQENNRIKTRRELYQTVIQSIKTHHFYFVMINILERASQ